MYNQGVKGFEMALSEKELAKLKKATYALMCQDRQRLLVRFPFTGGILMRMEFVPVRDRRLRTAATDGDRVFMDIAFCAGLSADERLFVMAHEVWHCVLMHMLRCQTRERFMFNVAADMEVNRMLKKEGVRTLPDCLMPKDEWDGFSAEEIYECICKEPRPFQGSGQGEEEGDNLGGGQFDKHVYGNDADNGDSRPNSNAADEDDSIRDQWGEVGFDRDYEPIITKDLADKIREHSGASGRRRASGVASADTVAGSAGAVHDELLRRFASVVAAEPPACLAGTVSAKFAQGASAGCRGDRYEWQHHGRSAAVLLGAECAPQYVWGLRTDGHAMRLQNAARGEIRCLQSFSFAGMGGVWNRRYRLPSSVRLCCGTS